MIGRRKAPEIISDNGKNWINSKPLSLDSLQGKVVLLDFWAYSCVNCVRTLPALREIWKKYKDKRFVLIGIHTPEFEFEKEIGNVKYAVKKHRLDYPVLQDADRINWERYGNRFWPRAALIDSEGRVVMDHVGESGYDKIDLRIAELLKSMGEIDEIKNIKEEGRNYMGGISPETYIGSLRGKISSGKVCSKDGCDEYSDSGEHERDSVYLDGDWNVEKEYSEFLGRNGHIAYRFFASEVNLVLSGYGKAEVLLNDKPIPKDKAGKDIFFEKGKSYVHVEGADMYNLVKSKEFFEGDLKIIAFEEMKAYAFTFG